MGKRKCIRFFAWFPGPRFHDNRRSHGPYGDVPFFLRGNRYHDLLPQTVSLAIEVLVYPDKVQVKPLDGVSLFPILKGKKMQRSKPIPFKSGRQIALSGKRFKLYGLLPPRKKRNKRKKSRTRKEKTSQKEIFWELYDLQSDPTESRDLIDRHPQVFEKMKNQLLGWRKSYRNSRRGIDYRKGE